MVFGAVAIEKRTRMMKFQDNGQRQSKLVFTKRIDYRVTETNRKRRNPYNDQFGLITDIVLTDEDFWAYMTKTSRN